MRPAAPPLPINDSASRGRSAVGLTWLAATPKPSASWETACHQPRLTMSLYFQAPASPWSRLRCLRSVEPLIVPEIAEEVRLPHASSALAVSVQLHPAWLSDARVPLAKSTRPFF